MSATIPTEFTVNLPWTESPFFEADLRKANLDEATTVQVRQFSEQGFLIFDPQIPMSIIDEARQQAEPLIPTTHANSRVQDAWKTVPAVQQIAAAPRVLDMLRVLYRREPIPFQTLNFAVGTQQRTHSDSIHFNSIPQRFMCGVWVALEDVRDDNGPLHYFPGSHKLPFYDLVDMGMKGTVAKTAEEVYGKLYPRYEDFIAAMTEAHQLKKAVLNMKKGQAIIWSANLLHGGEPIQTPGSTRHSQVTHYYFNDCIYYTPLRSDAAPDRLYIRQITNIVNGAVIKNKYFDEELTQTNEGYSARMNIPPILLKIGGLIPSSLRAKLKKFRG
ncbi:phytanoyl-CoA dioxygenase family protein [Fibrella aquatica]|uniref:phytanoyl-CoA dioxygenase family protein n=1 Tax=Fibrella aquatica TaxID=3242487 RepID=UPI0035201AEE